MKKILTKGALLSTLAAFMIMSACGTGNEEIQEIQPSVLYIYTEDENFDEILQNVYEAHPDWNGRIRTEIITEDYYNTVNTNIDKIKNPPKENKKQNSDEAVAVDIVYYPDLIVAKLDNTELFNEAEYTVPLTEVGIGEDDMKQMYSYTIQTATDSNGMCKALSWEADMAAFLYRRSIATEVFGTDDPKDVQSYMRDRLTYEDTAIAISKKTEGKVSMLSSAEDIKADLKGSKFFGLYAGTEFIFDELAENCGGKALGQGSFGDWNVCAGPEPYINGGSWIYITEDCCDKDFAASVMKAICCETGTLEKLQKQENIVVNNAKVMSNAYNSGKGKADILGGNDYLGVYIDVATGYDITESKQHTENIGQ